MSGINKAVIFGISRLKARFEDGVNAPKNISGTGFWIRSARNKQLLVTNKHNVDPKLVLGADTRFTLVQLEVQLRKTVGDQVFPDTGFFSITNIESCIRLSANDDCAILVEPIFDQVPANFSHNNIVQATLADATLLNDKVAMMDLASFIGFPGDSQTEWWDQKWNLPVARLVNVASWPGIPYTNADVKTGNAMLVSGLSFSGSSGSPLFLHQKGLAPTSGDVVVTDANYLEPKIVGIMSGHWWLSEESTPPMFRRHSGLSYVTRSTSILDLITQHAL